MTHLTDKTKICFFPGDCDEQIHKNSGNDQTSVYYAHGTCLDRRFRMLLVLIPLF